MSCHNCFAVLQPTDAFCGNCGERRSLVEADSSRMTSGNFVCGDIANRHACRLYSPLAVGLYTLLTLPVGVFLHGLNAYRRGKHLTGAVWLVSAVLLMVVAFRSAPTLSYDVALSTLFAVALWRKEELWWKRDLAAGARAARWWPPLLLTVLVSLSIAVLFVS